MEEQFRQRPASQPQQPAPGAAKAVLRGDAVGHNHGLAVAVQHHIAHMNGVASHTRKLSHLVCSQTASALIAFGDRQRPEGARQVGAE